MASCILNYGDVRKKNVTFKVRPFVPAVRIPAARKRVGGAEDCRAAVSKQMKRRTHLSQYVHFIESHYVA